MRIRYMLVLSVFLVLLPVVSAGAQDPDSGLYAPQPPVGSAFVRFANFTDGEEDAETGADAGRFGPLTPMTVSAYRAVPKGRTALSIGQHKTAADLEAGKFYTVLAVKDAIPLRVLEDPPAENRAKALLILYNVDRGSDISLKAKGGTLDVVEDVPAAQNASREVNASKVGFTIHTSDGKLLTELEPVILERGNAYGIFYGNEQAVFVTGETVP